MLIGQMQTKMHGDHMTCHRDQVTREDAQQTNTQTKNSKMKMLLTIVLLVLLVDKCTSNSFVVNYDGNSFSKDGQPFRYISGSIHYARVPRGYWDDRLKKMYATGLNAIQVYVPWNFHERSPGRYTFEDNADLVAFLQKANETGLLVILRPGPYICAEWDMGGLPSWLLKDGVIGLRTMDEAYIQAVDRWMGVLLPKIKPLLYSNGGPIISVQVENEYGSYSACDHDYIRHLKNTFEEALGADAVVLFTTDGPGQHMLECGTLQGLYTTVDFGSGIDPSGPFNYQRKFEPKGPLVNSEFYTGWLDHWGQKHSTVAKDRVTGSLDKILATGASVNMYMFEGGTNFGFWNGANSAYSPQPTSYDYDAPLTEAGDPTDKLMAIRDVIKKYAKVPSIPVPPATPKLAYGKSTMTKVGSLYDVLNKLAPDDPIRTNYPITMEAMQQSFGFIMYRTKIPINVTKATLLDIPGIRDRGYIIINQVPVGIVVRNKPTGLTITASKGDTLDIVVENQGRINYGGSIADMKGIIGNITLGGTILEGFNISSLQLDEFVPKISPNLIPESTLTWSSPQTQLNVPTLYSGTMPNLPPDISEPRDTFLKMSGWTKGQAYINGFNLGRYWPVEGPQVTLYVPATILKVTGNVIVLFELESAPCSTEGSCTVEFIDRPILNGTIARVHKI
ncbi:beta-galactosidase-like [Anneissia japonica]|uniref:beta-galactosidase-like n=1 Tax=Anneissia japonica TaxID=1529436 RepID=UPI0014255A68|nr:beta-galactosidase-like [Anneissia japonica]